MLYLFFFLSLSSNKLKVSSFPNDQLSASMKENCMQLIPGKTSSFLNRIVSRTEFLTLCEMLLVFFNLRRAASQNKMLSLGKPNKKGDFQQQR